MDAVCRRATRAARYYNNLGSLQRFSLPLVNLNSVAATEGLSTTDGYVCTEMEQVHTLVLKIRPPYLTEFIKVVKAFGIGDSFGSIDVLEVRCTTAKLPLRPPRSLTSQLTLCGWQLRCPSSVF